LARFWRGTIWASPAESHPVKRAVLRVFREDMLQCPFGGRRVVLAFINDEKV